MHTAMSKLGSCSSREAGTLLSFPGACPRTAPSARAPGYGVSVHASHAVRRAAVEVGDELG